MYFYNILIRCADSMSRKDWQVIEGYGQVVRDTFFKDMSVKAFNVSFERAARRSTAVQTDIKALVRRLPTMPRYVLDKDVAEAMAKMSLLDHDTLVKAFPFARLPAPAIWVESANNFFPGMRLGFLIEEETCPNKGRIIHIKPYSALSNALGELPVRSPHGDITVTKDGFFHTLTGKELRIEGKGDKKLENVRTAVYGTMGAGSDRKALKDKESFYQTLLNDASNMLSLLLLLNSRSQVLDSTADIQETNANWGHPLKRGEYLPARQIRFNLDRIFRKHPGVTPEQARDLRYTTLRIGHFKIKPSGVYWWSPHNVRITKVADPKNAETTNEAEAPHIVSNRIVVKSKQADIIFPGIK